MKRIIAALLILCCLCASLSALADSPFTLRCGIRFGDSRYDIERKEDWQAIRGSHFFEYAGTLYDMDAMVTYRCPSDGLRSVLYSIGVSYGAYGVTEYAATDEGYLAVQKQMNLFYGRGTETRTERCTDILLNLYTSWLSSTAGDRISDIDSLSFLRQTSWTVPVEGGRVYICLQSFRVGQDGHDRYMTLVDMRIGYEGEFLEWLYDQH